MACSLSAARYFQRWTLVLFMLAFSVSLSWPGTAAAEPAVTANSPVAGATGVPVTATVAATFSEPLDPATVTPGSFTLSQPVKILSIAAGYNFSLILKDNGTVSGWGYNGNGQTSVPSGLDGVTAIAAGSNHVAAVKNDKTVIAWGENSSGQSTVPAGLAGVTAVAAGESFTLALKADGSVVAWGDNSRGQTSLPGGLAGVTRIAAGIAHALALRADGTVVAWGDNSYGQTAVPPGLFGVVAVAAGHNHALALKNDGTVVAWGANTGGQTSVPESLAGVIGIAARLDYSMALKTDGTVVAWGDNSHGQTAVPAGLTAITAIAAGYYHAVALKKNGTVVSWGDNSCSQTTLPAGLAGVTAVAAGSGHTVALKSDGTLFAWGYNSNGQADIPAGLSGVVAPAAGFAHTLALNAAGTVFAWGQNDHGQTTLPAGLAGVIAVAAGDNHSVALRYNGTVVAWGNNSAGQVTVPGGLAAVTDIAAGTAHTLVLKHDGTVTSWGSNSFNAVTPPIGLSGVIAIAAAGYHSVALKSDGTVTAWGDNSREQSTVPAGLTNVIAVAAGSSHTIALKGDGTVVAWGANDLGQTAVPAGLSGVIGIAAGNGYTIAVKNDGTLVSWGDNKIGQATVPQDPYGQDVETLISYSTGSNSATITPAAALPLATTLTVTVNRGIRSLGGTHPATDYSWSFTTTAPLDTTASPAPGIYGSAQTVTLIATEPATIYYTTNGNDPTFSSPVYGGPIPVPATTTLKFFARDMAGNSETPKTATYTIAFDTTPPVTTAAPAGGTYSSLQNVTLTATEPATIYYTTNGATPTVASSVYAGPIPIAVTTVLKFFARDTAGNSEAPKTATYTINFDTTPPVTTASPAGGTYSSLQNVTLTANEPATIYYTTNGATPTDSSAVYSGSIPIPATATLKFFARDTAGNSETVKTESYTIKLNQSITFAPLTARAYGNGSFTLGAFASSGLPISYSSSNPAVATVSGATVTIVGSGTTTITASQGGNAAYNAAPAVSQPLAVSKAALTVRAVDATRVYGTTNPVLSATYSGFVNGDSQTVLTGSPLLSTAATSVSPVGTYPIAAAAGTLSAANYTFSFTAGTLTVTKAGQAISFGALAARTYGDAAVTLSATAGSGLAVSYTSSNSTVATVNGALLTIVGTGTTTITASQNGNGNYDPAPAVAQPLTINRATATVTLGNLSASYDGTPKAATATSEPAGLTVTLTYNGSATVPSAAGSYLVVGTVSDPNHQGSASGTLVIAKANQTITFEALPAKTYGDPAFSLTATAGSGLGVSYTSSNSAVAAVSGTTVTIVGAGTATITASQGGDGNYNAAAEVVQTVTINKAVATVTLGSLSTTYDGTPKAATATTTPAALTVALTYNGTATMPTAAGSYPVVGSVTDPNYEGSASGMLTIAKASQAITFGALPVKTYGDSAFSLSATAASGLGVSYTSSNAAVATFSGNNVTIVGAGTATITASQAGDGNYNAAADVARTLTINKAAATVTLGDLSTFYAGAPKAATATTEPVGLTVTMTYNGSATAPTAVGSYTVVGTISEPNYQGSASGTLTIVKANQTITFTALPVKTYGDPSFTLSATAGSGLAVTYTSSNTAVATVSSSTLTIVGAGTAVITATQPGDANYNAAPAVTQTLTVNKAQATITFGLLAFTYDGSLKPVTVITIPAGLAVAITYDGLATAPVDVGKYTVVATVNDANYQGSATATEEISKKSQTITFGPLPVKTYGDAAFTFSASASSNLNLTFEYDPAIAAIIRQGKNYLLTIVGAGTTTVTATQGGNRNYSDAPPVSQTFVVNKAAATVALGSLSATYDGSAKAATATTTPAGLGVIFSYNGSVTPPIAAGSYTVIGTINNANYQGSASGTLTIAKSSQAITFGALSAKSYGSAPFNPNATASSGLGISYTSSNPAVAAINGTTVTIVGVGTTVITASQGGNGNYIAAAAVLQTLAVAKGAQAITFNALPLKTAADAPFTIDAAATSGLLVSYTSSNPAVATISGTTVTIIGAGTTVIIASQGGGGNYNAAAAIPQTLTVNKGTAAVIFGGLSAFYNGTPLAATATTVPSGLAVTFTYNDSATVPVAVGSYAVVATVTDPSYEGSATATLTIAKAAQAISFGPLTGKSYGEPAFTLTASAGSNLAVTYTSSNPGVATISGSTVTIAGAGTTTIIAAQGGDGSYNAAAAVPQTLTVSKGTASISLAGLSTFYNGTSRAATATTVPGGLPVTLTYNDSATAPTAAGSYTVTATITSPNYLGSATGTLAIAKGAQTITFGPLPVKTVGNAPFTLSAASTSGLAVGYSSSNPAVATISGTTVTIVGAGTTFITVSQNGDANHDAATAVVQTLTVNAAPVPTGKAAVTIGATTSFYDTLTTTLAAIAAGSTATVKLQALTFAETLDFNISGATVTLFGGYDSGFNSATGMTTILGNIVISGGTLIADKLVIM